MAHGLNIIAGVPLIDLEGLFLGVWVAPQDYIWLYLMLFSTILPTALHFLISLLGVQGLWPLRWRRPVAGWVKGATASAPAAVWAGLSLAIVWALPIYILAALIWVLWHFAGRGALWFLGWYYDRLLWIADLPVGVF